MRRFSILTLALSLLCPFYCAAQASPAESDPWGKLLYEMQTHFSDLSDTSRWIHILPIARSVTWDKPAGEEDLWDTGDRIAPMTLLYSKGNGRFSLNWEEFIYSLDLGGHRGPNKDREKAENAWVSAVNARNKLETKLVGGYEESQKGKPPRFRTPWYAWYNENAGPKLAVANKKVADALADYQQYLDPSDATNAAINQVLSYLSAGKLSPGEDPNRLSARKHPYALTANVTTFIADGDANKNQDKWPFTWSIDHDTKADKRETSNLGGSASLFGFIKVGGGGSHESINTSHQQFKLVVRFRNLEKMELKPAGGWFDPGVLDQFKDGPYKTGHDKAEFFGPSGKLKKHPIEVILAYQPEIEGTLLTEEYNFFKQSLSGGGGFSIGPFSFNASGGSTLTEEGHDNKTTSFKVTSVSTTPQLIAVISAIEQ